MKNRLYYEDGVEQSAVPFDSIMLNGRAQFIEVTKSEIPASSLSCSGMRSKFLAKPSFHAVGMAVAQPLDFEIDLARNPISESAA